MSQADIRDQWFRDLPPYRLNERRAIRFELTFQDAPGGKYFDYFFSQKFQNELFNWLAAYQCEVARIHIQNVPPLYRIASERLAPLREWTTDFAVQYSSISTAVQAMNEFNAVEFANRKALGDYNTKVSTATILAILACILVPLILLVIVGPLFAIIPWIAAIIVEGIVLVIIPKSQQVAVYLVVVWTTVLGYPVSLVVCEILAIILSIIVIVVSLMLLHGVKKKSKRPVPKPNTNPQEWCMVKLLDVFCDGLEPIDFGSPIVRDRNTVNDDQNERKFYHQVNYTQQAYQHY